MSKKTSRATAIKASDKLSDSLYQIYMLGDLLSAADETLENESRARAGETILELANEAKEAASILSDRWSSLENAPKSMAKITPINQN